MIATIAALCGFYMYAPYSLPPKDNQGVRNFHHRYCMNEYRLCMDKKFKGQKPSAFGKEHQQDFVWACMAEIVVKPEPVRLAH